MLVVKSDLELETVLRRIETRQLDLQPDFQRGEIWDLKRRQRLIDTILRDWYVPAVHIVVDEEGNDVVLDGQQRLAAIRDFVAGDFAVDGHIEPPNEVTLSLHGKRFPNFPISAQRAFMRFIVPVVTLTKYGPQEPNELFFRLNQSFNLTPPEKRNALHGIARDQVRQLVDELESSGLLTREVVGFSNRRLAYDDIVARVCVAVQKDTLRSHINNNTVEDFYRGSKFDQGTMDGLLRAGRDLLTQVRISDHAIKFNKGTLQTWLIYAYWAPLVTAPMPEGLLAQFEAERASLRQGGGVTNDRFGRVLEVVRLYDDRASYRVTDVSSVLIRDFAVHLFSEEAFGTPPRRGSDALLNDLELGESRRSAQVVVSEFLDAVRWGDPIVGRADS